MAEARYRLIIFSFNIHTKEHFGAHDITITLNQQSAYWHTLGA